MNGKRASFILFRLTLLGLLCISLLGCPKDIGYEEAVLSGGGVVDFAQCKECKSAPPKLIMAVAQYWRGRHEADYRKCFALEAPHIQLQFKSFAAYAKFFGQGLPVVGVRVKSISKVDEKLYEVGVEIENDINDPALRYTSYKDRWVKVGTAYRHVVRTLFGFIE